MKYAQVLFLLFAIPCWSQTATTGKAETKGACSPAVSGSKNTFIIKCPGLTKKQADEFLKVLNKLAQDPNHGFLTPSTEPPPPLPNSCRSGNISDTDTRIYWGGNVSVIRGDNTFSLVQIAGNTLLWARISPEGIKISGTMYSEDGAVVFLSNNEFWVNPSTTFHSENPDPHTLIVRDKWAKEVLRIHYLNPTAIRVTGRFFYPGRQPVDVTEREVQLGSISISGECYVGIPVAVSLQ
jgi:hypothetical protein